MILEHHNHDYENKHDYIILTIFDEILMQQVMFDKVKCVYGLYALDNYILPSNNMQCDDLVYICDRACENRPCQCKLH